MKNSIYTKTLMRILQFREKGRGAGRKGHLCGWWMVVVVNGGGGGGGDGGGHTFVVHLTGARLQSVFPLTPFLPNYEGADNYFFSLASP